MSVNTGRWTAQIEGDFVVFLIGSEFRDPARGPWVTEARATARQRLGA